MSWRNLAEELFADYNEKLEGWYRFQVRPPCRGEYEGKKDMFSDLAANTGHPLANRYGALFRDKQDLDISEIIVCNFLGAGRVSIGSVWELGRASKPDSSGKEKIIGIAMEDPSENEKNVHEHFFIRGMTPYVLPTLEEVIWTVVTVASGRGARTPYSELMNGKKVAVK
jgi:hypothetical protein